MWRARRAATVAVGAIVALALVPAAGALERDPAADGRGAPRPRVRIVDSRYRPRTLTVERGTRVRWRNAGSLTHTVTADDGSFDSGLLSTGQPFARRFRRAGTFSFHCRVHPRMTGTIRVV